MMSTKITRGWWSAIFDERVEAVLGENDFEAGLPQE